ncbi:unnamed protein product [Lepeophtheirus salmonis]|uniref:(salmon louse) hypothetical protein n=1 Tax=Lepeophtheirus salmonis TaxID=72036 RepID=A0A7R8H671_LEPSM|nr:unnamed protein product [Lepeophtheirus salmonis]CAF2876178.1 unnamed protein product [Lepeophtheirus salmonis]
MSSLLKRELLMTSCQFFGVDRRISLNHCKPSPILRTSCLSVHGPWVCVSPGRIVSPSPCIRNPSSHVRMPGRGVGEPSPLSSSGKEIRPLEHPGHSESVIGEKCRTS